MRPFDLSWGNLLSGPGPKLLSFVLNSLINSVRTPDMLQLWGYKQSATCPLCNAPKCTLHHELVGCKVANDQGRYYWRHDSVLCNIEAGLSDLLNRLKTSARHNKLKQIYPTSFVRSGAKISSSPHMPVASILEGSIDWNMSVDYKHKLAVFPPIIYPTDERPDIVLWSESSRRVVLLELTCPAEEGIEAARVRKEDRYSELLSKIDGTKCWSAELFTLEIGARGLVACRTFKVFRLLGFSAVEANTLCRSLSVVSARCSFAIHLAHTVNAWIPRGLIRAPPPRAPPMQRHKSARHSLTLKHSSTDCTVSRLPAASPSNLELNLHTLFRRGVSKLYHFTDSSCLPSIEKFGLLSWVGLEKEGIRGRKGSSALSRTLDQKKNLGDFVRLSFTPHHPMLFVALKEKRLLNPVILEVNLSVVLTPGTLFSDRNAAAFSAVISDSPSNVRFDVVLCQNQFDLPPTDRRFFQAEVLIPAKVPALLLRFPERPAPFAAPAPSHILRTEFLPSPSALKPLTSPLKPPADFLAFSSNVISAPAPSHILTQQLLPSPSALEPLTSPLAPPADFLAFSSNVISSHSHLSPPCKLVPPWKPSAKLSLVSFPWKKPPSAPTSTPPKLRLISFPWTGPPPTGLPFPPTSTPSRPSPLRSFSTETPLLCQFHVGPSPPCCNCVTGVFVCQLHLVLCNSLSAATCPFCKRNLCRKHVDCFCNESEANRDEIKSNRNHALACNHQQQISSPHLIWQHNKTDSPSFFKKGHR